MLKVSLRTLKPSELSNASLHEGKILLTLVEKTVYDLELFVDSNVDVLSDAAFNKDILKKHEAVQLKYLNEAALAEAYTHEIKAEFEKDRLAGCLPVGVTVPTFDGNVLEFPTFWDTVVPLVHENSKVSKFYKLNYLKSAMKGSSAEVLNSFPSTAESFELAVAVLQKRYGKNQISVRNHLEDLLKGQRIDNDAKQLRSLINKVAAKNAILSHQEVTRDLLFVLIVENQLSRPMKKMDSKNLPFD